MKSIPTLKQKYNDQLAALNTPGSFSHTTLAAWLQEIADELQARGVTLVADTAGLSSLAGNDIATVMVTNKGLYKFNASGTPNGTTSFPASGTGVWEQVLTPGVDQAVLDTTVSDAVSAAVPSAVSSEVASAVPSAVSSQLSSQLPSAVSTEVGNQVPAAVAAKTGDLTTLSTTNKATLVAAVNEVSGSIDTKIAAKTGDLSTLSTTNKSTLVAGVNEVLSSIDTKIAAKTGDLSTLSTTAKGNLAAAINEIAASTSVGGDLSTLTTTNKSSLVGAINEVNGSVDTKISAKTGDLTSLGTTAKTTLVDAVNEVNTARSLLSNTDFQGDGSATPFSIIKDTTPVSGSTKVITSGAVYTVKQKLDTLINDTTPSATTVYSSTKVDSLISGLGGGGGSLPVEHVATLNDSSAADTSERLIVTATDPVEIYYYPGTGDTAYKLTNTVATITRPVANAPAGADLTFADTAPYTVSGKTYTSNGYGSIVANETFAASTDGGIMMQVTALGAPSGYIQFSGANTAVTYDQSSEYFVTILFDSGTSKYFAYCGKGYDYTSAISLNAQNEVQVGDWVRVWREGATGKVYGQVWRSAANGGTETWTTFYDMSTVSTGAADITGQIYLKLSEYATGAVVVNPRTSN